MHSVLKSLLIVGSVTLVSCGDDDGATSTTPDAGEQPSNEDASTNDDETTSSATSSDDTTTTREGPWGCYLQESHVCDCAIETEAECDDVGLWVEGCASCVVEAEDAGSDANVATDAATSEVGPGCYDPATHACGCDNNETDCLAADGLWVDECECPIAPTDAATPSTGDSGSNSDADAATTPAPTGPGCYDPVVHECACDTNESACTDAAGVWAHECECPLGEASASDSGAGADSGVSTETTSDSGTASTDSDAATISQSQDAASDASADPSIGCYIPADTQCDCEIADESACDLIEGIWTPGCTSCIVDAAQ